MLDRKESDSGEIGGTVETPDLAWATKKGGWGILIDPGCGPGI